jgi:hypothetical protein
MDNILLLAFSLFFACEVLSVEFIGADYTLACTPSATASTDLEVLNLALPGCFRAGPESTDSEKFTCIAGVVTWDYYQNSFDCSNSATRSLTFGSTVSLSLH